MIGYLLVLLAFALALVMLAFPKIGSLAVWPILFLYPHLYLQRLELLPWNIGIDDLFVCVFFVIVVVRRNIVERLPIRAGLTLLGASGLFGVVAVANLSGWSMMPELPAEFVVKDILKGLIVVLFSYAMLHTIDTLRDLERVVLAFILTLTAAGLTVVLHRLLPGYFYIFSLEKFERAWRYTGEVQRATGSLVNPNIGSVLLAMTVFFCICRSRATQLGLEKMIYVTCIPVLLTGMVMARSRSGLASLGIALLFMACISRHRRYAVVLLFAGVTVVVFKPEMFLDFWERIAEVYNPEVQQFGAGASSRVEIWVDYFHTSTAQVWLLGQGFAVGELRTGMNAHNVWVSALLVHGAGGLIWLLLFFGTLIRRIWWLAQCAPEQYRTIWSGVAWGVLVWFLGGIALDMLTQIGSRYIYFFYAILIERAYALARQATPLEPAPSPNPYRASSGSSARGLPAGGY